MNGDSDERKYKHIDNSASTVDSVAAVEAILYAASPGIISVEDIAAELGITESRARLIIEDAIEYGTPRIEVTPAGDDVYHVEGLR